MSMNLKSVAEKARDYLKSPQAEAVRYVIIGGCTTLVDYIAFLMLVPVLGLGITAGNVISTVLAILFAYITNKIIVFQSRTASVSALVGEFVKFISARLVTMAIEIGGVYLFVNIIGQDSRIGKLEAIIIVIITNYFLSKFLVFQTKRHKDNN